MSNRHVRTFEVHRYAENGERGKAQFLLLPREDEVRVGNLIHKSSPILTNQIGEDLWTMGNGANIQCCQFPIVNSNVVLPNPSPFTHYSLLISHLSLLISHLSLLISHLSSLITLHQIHKSATLSHWQHFFPPLRHFVSFVVKYFR